MREGRILSDISKRVLIVKGLDEVNRILHLEEKNDNHIVKTKKLAPDLYEIELIKKVGSFFEVLAK